MKGPGVPAFHDAIHTTAPVEAVWRLLYDPIRFPGWWAGLETVESAGGDGGSRTVTFYPEGWPDFPMPQAIASAPEDRHVRVSCMVSDLVFDWRLLPIEAGGTRIDVHVEIPEAEAHRLAMQQEVIAASLRRLASMAEADGEQ